MSKERLGPIGMMRLTRFVEVGKFGMYAEELV